MSVTFRSTAFNTSAPERHFVSRRAYGSDLANWLIHELARHDATVEPMIGQKDAGWLVRFRFRGANYDFVTRYRGPGLGGRARTQTKYCGASVSLGAEERGISRSAASR